ncbi:MAG TPA: DUF4260 domain-containing protein [Deinococcales bacterium]|nr:DUF4260 domain-containing protein [Deinococcales bacterium]
MNPTEPSRNPLHRPALILRAEDALLMAACTFLFFRAGGSPWLLVLLALAPDLSMLGYLAGTRVGAAAYNLAHTLALPAVLGVVSLQAGSGLGLQVALVWLAHIFMDRAVGYGLKLPTGFKDTHLSGAPAAY